MSGAVALFALFAAALAPAAADELPPEPAALQRMTRLWYRQLGPVPDGGVAIDGTTAYLLLADRNHLVAVDVTTGRERWSAAVPSRRGSDPPRGRVVVSGTVVVAEGADDRLAGFSAAGAARLWRRQEVCKLAAAASTWVLLRCPQRQKEAATLEVVEARTGRRRHSMAIGRADVVTADASAVYVWSESSSQVRKLVPGRSSPVWERPAGAWRPDSLVVDGGVLLSIGRDIEALDVASGAVLWTRTVRPPGRGPWAAPLVASGKVYLVTPEALLVLAARTGAEEHRLALPTFGRATSPALVVLAAGERVLLFPMGRVPFVGWPSPGRPAQVLRNPLIAIQHVTAALAGDLFISLERWNGLLAAHSLRDLQRPLADLPAQDAVRAAEEEVAPKPGGLVEALRGIPGAKPHLVRRAQDRGDPLRESMLIELADDPDPALLPLFLDLYTESQNDPRMRTLAIRGLEPRNDPRASEITAAIVRSAGRGAPDWDVAAAQRQLWRTGRTAGLGFCKAGARRLDDLGARGREGVFGTDHPVVLEAAAPDGRWLSICQAREDTNGDGQTAVDYDGHHGYNMGDALRPYLVVGGGPGHAFDELLGHDPTGRYVAIREGLCLALVDTVERTATTLPDADVRDHHRWYGQHRAVSFSAAGDRLLYFRGDASGGHVVVRSLPDGRETAIQPGPGLLWRAALDPAGRWVVIKSVLGGRWPAAGVTMAPRSCRGWLYEHGDDDPADLVIRLAPATGGPPREIPGLAMPLGDEMLVRAADGAIVAQAPGGQTRVAVAASCRGRVVHADAARKLVVAACASDRDAHERVPLTFHGPGMAKKVGHTVFLPRADRWIQTRDRFVDLVRETLDLDLKTVTTRPLGTREVRPPRTLGRDRHEALLLRGDGAELRPAQPGRGRAAQGPLRWRPPTAAPAPGR